MKRAALVAGASLAAALMTGAVPALALPGESSSWSGFNKSAEESKAARRTARNADRSSRKPEPADKSPPAPTGLLHVIVSIDKQRATLFADGHPVAGTAVSTGAPGHPTPMGLFTVIQKDRHHVSNLYNASMPYMQRITWSGSALHEGPLPGYPASHGCVRLTSNFAQFLWKTTKMGARVIVTRPDVAPADFEHAKLFVPRPKTIANMPLPQPSPLNVAAPATVPAATPVVMPASLKPAVVPIEVAEPDLTSGVKVKTVDASHSVSVAVPADEAKPAAASTRVEQTTNTPSGEQLTRILETNGTSSEADPAVSQAAAPEAQPIQAKPAEAATAPAAEAAPEAKPVGSAETKPAEAAPVETKAAETTATDTKPAETATADQKAADAKPAEAAPVAETKPGVEEKTAETKPAEAAPVAEAKLAVEEKAVEAKPVVEEKPVAEVKPTEVKPTEATPVETNAVATKPAAEEKAAESKPAETATETAAAPAPAEEKYPTVGWQEGKPISVFASLKEGKVYVRQGWKALFAAPVTFDNPSQPIGTHLFTAMSAKADGSGLRWTVVTIPSGYKRVAEAREGRKSRGAQPVKVAVEPAAPSSASVALDRINLPQDLVDRISEMWMPGSSLIVSDNRLSDETGDDTDFIVTTF
jgi:lipoprotein-anchoring transpeptidase ErfK/SrfK